MKIPPCSLSVWKNLYDAASAFGEIEPWEWMSDIDAGAFRLPRVARSATVACLVNWARCSAWSSTLEPKVLNNTEEFNQGNSMRALPSLFIANTVSRLGLAIEANSTKPISKLSNSSASSFIAAMRGRNFAVSNRAIIRGISRKVARYLTLCLGQARHIALRLEKDPDWLSAPNKNHYLVRVPVDEPSQSGKAHENSAAVQPSMGQQLLFKPFDEAHGWQWKTEWLKPAPLTLARVRPCSIDEVRLQRIKNSNQSRQGIWEVDAYYTPSPVDGDDRPFFPYTYLCADHESGFLFDSVLAEPSMWQPEFCEAFLKGIETNKLLPNTLWVRKEELRDLFEPLTTRLSIEVRLAKKLPAIDRAKRELLKFLKTRG